MTFDGLNLLAWIIGLTVLWACWRCAVYLHDAERIEADHPEAVTGLDRLQAEGYAAYSKRDAA